MAIRFSKTGKRRLKPPEASALNREIMVMKRKKRRRPNEEAGYVCDACGEEIVIPVDLSAGESQEYVEDCPVCCRPSIIHVEIDEGGDVRVWAESE
jgi:hypothetical protein